MWRRQMQYTDCVLLEPGEIVLQQEKTMPFCVRFYYFGV